MKEDFITFETAKLAKEKGFNYNCYCGYDKNGETYRPHYWEMSCDTNMLVIRESDLDEDVICLAPTQSLLQRWLRVEHKLDVIVSVVYTGDGKRYHCDLFTTYMSSLPSIFDTYEEALEEGLQEALKLI